MPLPPTTISLDDNGTRHEVQPGAIIEGSGAEARIVVAGPDQPTLALQRNAGDYQRSFGTARIAGEFVSKETIGPGKHWLHVNYPNNLLSTQVKFEYRAKPVPVASKWFGTISDNGSVTDNIRAARSFGFDAMREWVGWYASGDINPGEITRCHAYLNAQPGINMLICLTPPQGASQVTYPTAAIQRIIKPVSEGGLDRRVIIGIINEPNYSDYYPGNKWLEAFKTASRISAELRAAGFKTASPSLVDIHNGASELRDKWSKFKELGYTNFDYLDFHNYTLVGPGGEDKAVAYFEEYCKAAREIADSLGMKVMCSEWGMYVPEWENVGDPQNNIPPITVAAKLARFATVYPRLCPIMKKYVDVSAYFIMRQTPDHTKWGLHLIDSTNNATALGNAAKAYADAQAGGVP